MPTLTVELGDRSYPLVLERGALATGAVLAEWIGSRPVYLISDRGIPTPIRDALLDAFPKLVGSTEFSPTESDKTLAQAESFARGLAQARLPREGLLIALGGGLTTDLAGFAAAIYLRGIDWIAIPSTLLAMADASVGGKTGVNLGGLKNLLGAFHQPRGVLIDPALLDSLPERPFLDGAAEILKSCCLEESSWRWADAKWEAFLRREGDPVDAAILRAVRIKAGIVSRDEKESGERMHLNLGHTLGHALETALGGEASHGACVATGLIFAARLGAALGLTDPAYAAAIEAKAAPLGLPAPLPRWEQLLPHLGQDKKRSAVDLRWILPISPGSVEVSPGQPLAPLLEAIWDKMSRWGEN